MFVAATYIRAEYCSIGYSSETYRGIYLALQTTNKSPNSTYGGTHPYWNLKAAIPAVDIRAASPSQINQ